MVLQKIYWEPCIYLCIHLVHGGAVICGPLVSGQRQTCWLLGCWETPLALISEKETGKTEGGREAKKKKRKKCEWETEAKSEETKERKGAERQMDGSQLSPLCRICLQGKPQPIFPPSPLLSPVTLSLSLSTKYRGLVQDRQLQPNAAKPQAQQTIT